MLVQSFDYDWYEHPGRIIYIYKKLSVISKYQTTLSEDFAQLYFPWCCLISDFFKQISLPVIFSKVCIAFTFLFGKATWIYFKMITPYMTFRRPMVNIANLLSLECRPWLSGVCPQWNNKYYYFSINFTKADGGYSTRRIHTCTM